MVKKSEIFLLLLQLLIFSCDRSANLKVEINSCPKQIELKSIETNDTGITFIKMLHNGFCYDLIDSVCIIKQYTSGTEKVFIDDTSFLGSRNISLDNKTDNNCQVQVKTHELNDTAKNISTKITAIYQNRSMSNTIEFVYQTTCKKEITNPTYKLLDTSACETSAGTGDRYLVSFNHKGYCTKEIDSIGGAGDFYSLDGYFWNSSDFLVPRERIIFHDSTTYLQQIDFKLCVTFHESDYVSNKIWLIYKDKTRSNKAAFDIVFVRHRKKHAIVIINKGIIQ